MLKKKKEKELLLLPLSTFDGCLADPVSNVVNPFLRCLVTIPHGIWFLSSSSKKCRSINDYATPEPKGGIHPSPPPNFALTSICNPFFLFSVMLATTRFAASPATPSQDSNL